MTGTTVRDFYGGNDRHIRGTDDLLILPLQSGTQWDALGHIIFDGKIYNGYAASDVGSKGAIRNDIAPARTRIAGRGVLLDVPRARGVPGSNPGEPIHAADLEAVPRRAGRGRRAAATSSSIRTGQMAQCRDAGSVGRVRRRVGPGPGPRHRPLDPSTATSRPSPPTRGAWRSCPTRPPTCSSRCTSC